MLLRVNLWIHFPNAKSLEFAFSTRLKKLCIKSFPAQYFFPTKCITKMVCNCEKRSPFFTVYFHQLTLKAVNYRDALAIIAKSTVTLPFKSRDHQQTRVHLHFNAYQCHDFSQNPEKCLRCQADVQCKWK